MLEEIIIATDGSVQGTIKPEWQLERTQETNKNSHEGMAAHKLVQASHLGLMEI
jgi:hypothetical protein